MYRYSLYYYVYLVARFGPSVGPFGPSVGQFGPSVGPVGPSVGPFGPSVGPFGPSVGPVGSRLSYHKIDIRSALLTNQSNKLHQLSWVLA